MPFQIGHEYGKRARVLEATLKRCVAQDDGKRLRAACEAVLTKASKGDLAAFQVLADRLDGRVKADDATGDGEVRSISLDELMRAIVRARSADAETIETVQAIAHDNQPVEPDQA